MLEKQHEVFRNLSLRYYRKRTLQLMRPYIPGEDLTGISISQEDTPELGGMIAVGNDNGAQWYVSKKYFLENYEAAQP